MKYLLMRDCCRSGNCFHCSKYGVSPQPYGQPARVEHARYDDQKRAKAVAAGWASHNAVVVEAELG